MDVKFLLNVSLTLDCYLANTSNQINFCLIVYQNAVYEMSTQAKKRELKSREQNTRRGRVEKTKEEKRRVERTEEGLVLHTIHLDSIPDIHMIPQVQSGVISEYCVFQTKQNKTNNRKNKPLKCLNITVLEQLYSLWGSG